MAWIKFYHTVGKELQVPIYVNTDLITHFRQEMDGKSSKTVLQFVSGLKDGHSHLVVDHLAEEVAAAVQVENPDD